MLLKIYSQNEIYSFSFPVNPDDLKGKGCSFSVNNNVDQNNKQVFEFIIYTRNYSFEDKAPIYNFYNSIKDLKIDNIILEAEPSDLKENEISVLLFDASLISKKVESFYFNDYYDAARPELENNQFFPLKLTFRLIDKE